MLFYLPAGAVVDRFDRKRIMLTCELGRSMALALIVVVAAAANLTFQMILAVAFVEGSLFVFFTVAETSALPQVVPRIQLPVAIAQHQAREQAAQLAGQPLGGVLFAAARTLPFLVDALSYLVSFFSLLLIRVPFQEERLDERISIRADIVEGVRWLWGNEFLRAAVLLVAGLNFVLNAVGVLLILRATDLGASSQSVGAMFAVGAAGGIAGAAIAPRVARATSPALVVIGVPCFWAVGVSALALQQAVLGLAVIYGAILLAAPTLNVVLTSYRYALAPDRLLGRVGSTARFVTWGAAPLGALAAGFSASAEGAAASLALFGGVSAAIAAAAFSSRSLRRPPPLEEFL
jgi:hypothetical protein